MRWTSCSPAGRSDLRGLFPALLLLFLILGHGRVHASVQDPGSAVDREAVLERAELLVSIARREVLRPDQCPYSPLAVVTHLSSDPETLAAFVRERVGYEPYLGVVRGARGTLAAGAGGDWDRALLLQALLSEAGFRSRLVVLHRTEEELQALVDAFLADRGGRRQVGAEPVDAAAAADRLAKLVGVQVEDTLRADEAREARWQALLDESFDAAAQLVPTLRETLAAAGPRLGQSFTAWRELLASGARERVLVELEQDGRVLDPSPDSKSISTSVLSAASRHAEPPVERRARFTLALHMSVAGEGAPVEPVELMTRTFDLDELFLRTLRFQVVPDGSASDGKSPWEWSEDEWYERLVGFERYQAILEVDRLWMASDAFDLYGRTFKVGGDGRIRSAQEIGQGVGTGFGGLAGQKPANEETPSTRIDALTLEIELSLPGRDPIQQRRLIYGSLRPEVSPVHHTDMLVFGGPVAPHCVMWRQLQGLIANLGELGSVLRSQDPHSTQGSTGIRVLSQTLHAWQLARLGLVDRTLATGGDLAALVGPAVVAKTTYLVLSSSGRTVGRRKVIDVLHDGLCLVPRAEDATQAAVEKNMLLGAACTVFESVLLAGQLPAVDLQGCYAEFERAALRGERPLVCQGSDSGDLELAPLTRWALENGAPGIVRVFPSKQRPSSWWSIDPNTGTLIGRGDGGEGQSAAEYQAALKVAITNLKCTLGAMNAVTGGNTGAEGAYDWFTCISDFDPKNPRSYTDAGMSVMQLNPGLMFGDEFGGDVMALSGMHSTYGLGSTVMGWMGY